MKRLLLAVLTLFTSSAVFGDALDKLAEGAPIYVAARPIALIGALQRAGVSELAGVKRLRQQMGGIDPFNPAILAAPGIDVAAPVAGALFEPLQGGTLYHHRIAATLRDPGTFTTFISAVAASGQVRELTRVDPASPQGKQGVLATAHPSGDLSLVLRLKGDVVVLDALQSIDDRGKAPLPAEVIRRFPLAPPKPFAVGRGARKLFAPESAVVLYVDGRRLGPLLAAIADDESRRAARWGDPAQRAVAAAKATAQSRKCAALWDHAPTTFDDLGLALTAAPDTLGLTLAWGTQGGTPLGGLALAPVDDGGLDAVELGRDATAVVALYAASLSPFTALRHSAKKTARSDPFAGSDALADAVKGCETSAGATLFVRSWPLALGALGAAPPSATASTLAQIRPVLSGLRTMVLALRDVPPDARAPRFAVGATFDSAARALVEAALAATNPSGGAGTPQTIGKRNATLYPLDLRLIGMKEGSVGIETLPANHFGFTVADSENSLGWAYRVGDAAAARPPVLRVAVDLIALDRMGEQLHAWRDEGQGEILTQLRRVDGELTSDGDMLRLDLHAPLKH